MEMAELLTDLGLWLRDSGDVVHAEQRFRQVMCREEIFGPMHRDSLFSAYLADALEGLGRVVEAEKLFDREVAWCRRYLGDSHPETQVSIRNLDVFKRKWTSSQESLEATDEVPIRNVEAPTSQHSESTK